MPKTTTKKEKSIKLSIAAKNRIKRDPLFEERRRQMKKKHSLQEKLIKEKEAMVLLIQDQIEVVDKDLEILEERMIERAEHAAANAAKVSAAIAAEKTAVAVTEKAVRGVQKKISNIIK